MLAAGVLLASFLLAADCRSETARATASTGVLIRQDAELTIANRIPGMPTSSAPGQQLERVSVDIETYGQSTSEPSYFVKARLELSGQPTGNPDAELNLGFGHSQGNSCSLAALLTGETSGARGTVYDFHGHNPRHFPTPSRPWDCVAAFVDNSFDGEPATRTYDALVAPLTDIRHAPRLRITRVDLLGKKQKNLRLVRGVPTWINVSFRNTGKAPSAGISVKGSGKGLRVADQRVRALSSGSTSSASVKVRLAGPQKRSRLRIVINDGSSRSVRTLRVTRVKPPRRPVSGSYRSRSGDVSFTVRRGRIVGWIGTMTTRCGGYPDNFHYSTNTYSFPTVRVPRNGILQAKETAELFSISLRLRISGRKAVQGLFNYYGPDRCFASANFTATRTGR